MLPLCMLADLGLLAAWVALESNKVDVDRKEVVKDLPAKRVKVGGEVMGLVADGDWHWAPVAGTRYSQQELDFAKASIKS